MEIFIVSVAPTVNDMFPIRLIKNCMEVVLGISLESWSQFNLNLPKSCKKKSEKTSKSLFSVDFMK